MDPAQPDWYAVLRVAPSATDQEIKAAYRALAQRYHPDSQSPDASAEQMRRLNAAYAVLGHPMQRKLYDLKRYQARQSGQKQAQRPYSTGFRADTSQRARQRSAPSTPHRSSASSRPNATTQPGNNSSASSASAKNAPETDAPLESWKRNLLPIMGVGVLLVQVFLYFFLVHDNVVYPEPVLNLSNRNFQAYPFSLRGEPRVRVVNLNGNRLNPLGEDIMASSGLQEISLSRNKLKGLPDGFERLRALRVLILSQNELSSLPLDLQRHANLEVLDLQENQFSEWPSELHAATRLRELHFTANPLTDLPSELAPWQHLRHLGLAQTELSPLDRQRAAFRLLHTRVITY